MLGMGGITLSLFLLFSATGRAEEGATKPVVGAPSATQAAFPSGGGNVPRPLESTSMEDLLLEKGVISLDDWIRIKAEDERRQSERSVVAEFTGSPRWYDRLTMYGYGMMRFNRLGNPDGKIRSYQDSSMGDQASGAQPGFFFRRIRWVVTGQISEHVSVFIQPDLASNISGNTHALSMRDAFGDWNFDKDKEYRLRVGLQRVPCSFDNWQASRVRMAIDRADGTNSCSNSERDMGVAFMWSPKIAQQRYKQMLDYMYGPGDYGVFHIQIYNGQGLNQQEANGNKHVGARLSWPWELPGGRLMETGVNAMSGKFRVSNGTLNTSSQFATLGSNFDGAASGNNGKDYMDQRVNFYVYFPPQPFGFIAEYTTGRGPKRGLDGVIRDSPLDGWYAQLHYQWKYSDVGLANFYSRYQQYQGGLKFQTGAPDDKMKEVETGIAWQPDPQWEFTVAHAWMDRRNTFNTAGGRQFDADGHLVRLQAIWFWN
jgi:hypothetical protein